MSSETPRSTRLELSARQVVVLLVSIIFVALCGIAYELIIAAASSYLLGNSVYQFSLTIGFFMFAMGIGSFLSRLIVRDLVRSFIVIEIVISIAGGLCSLTLFIVYAYVTVLYVPVMYFFIILIGVLVGLEAPLLTRILSHKEVLRKSISDVLSLDYIGALIGSVAFPLLLLPTVGLIRSSFVIGLINILTAVVNLYYFKAHVRSTRWLVWVSVLVLAALSVLTGLGSRLSSFAEQHLYQDQVIYRKQTPYQRIVVTQNGLDGRFRMFIDGHIQFSERDEYRYHEALVHPVMSLAGRRAHILILGGGDGLAAREVLKYAEVRSVTIVDIDPAITRFSASFPALRALNRDSLRDPRVKVVNADAFNYLQQTRQRYDRVIIDMPDPHNEALSKLYSREFYRLIARRLAPDGALVTQSSSPFFARRTYWSVARTIRAAGYHLFSYQVTIPAFGIWGFHLGRRTQVSLAEIRLSVPTRFLTDKVLASAAVFGKDIAPVDSPVNTLLEPVIYMLYVKDLRD